MSNKVFVPTSLPLRAWWRPEDYKPGQPWIDCIGGQKLTGDFEVASKDHPLAVKPETIIVTESLTDEQQTALKKWLLKK